MMIIFHFTFKILKNPIFKIKLSKIVLNVSTCTKCLILQNGLHVNEILILKKIELCGALKNTYVLSKYGCYSHNISKF
jgi:hypothetical protein